MTSAAEFGFLGGVIDEVRERAQGGRHRTAAIQRFTRDLWRALRPSLMPDPRRPGWSERYLLQACEASVARLAADPGSEPVASRTLFSAARSLMRALADGVCRQERTRGSRIVSYSHFRSH